MHFSSHLRFQVMTQYIKTTSTAHRHKISKAKFYTSVTNRGHGRHHHVVVKFLILREILNSVMKF